MRNPMHPSPAPPAFGKGKVVPEVNASWFSLLFFNWLGPILSVGYSRPLEKDDLYDLPPNLLTQNVTDLVEANFYARCEPAQRPAHIQRRSPASPSSSGSSADTGDKEKDASSASDAHGSDAEKQEQAQLPKRGWYRHPGTGETPVTRKGEAKYDGSLLMALNTSFFYRWWAAGLFRFAADMIKTTTPLLSKRILTYLSQAYVFHRLSSAEAASLGIGKPQGLGYGIGLAFALFAMQEAVSLLNNHFQVMAMRIGLSARMSLIGLIFRKSLRLSGKARSDHSAGQITTMISTDASRMDFAALTSHDLWLAPIQIILGIALLLNNLGVSALVGLGVLVLGFPLQAVIVRTMFRARMRGVKITDTRVRLTGEVLQGIRLIKYYAWEAFYAEQLGRLRGQEVKTIRRIALMRATLISMFTFIPVLAAVLSFITYSLTGHDLNVAVIFSSLQFFNVIQLPLIMLPFAMSMCADAAVALQRISKFLVAEDAAEPYAIRPNEKHAIQIKGGFRWDTVGPAVAKFDVGLKKKGEKAAEKKAKAERKAKEKKEREEAQKAEASTKNAGSSRGWFGGKKRKESDTVLPVADTPRLSGEDPEKAGDGEGEGSGAVTPSERKEGEEQPFALDNLDISIPQGSFVAIVGRVGSGKSSLLNAMIGEMRRTSGEVLFSGPVAYVPQTAWIQNATLRANVTFGRPDDETKFRDVIRACALEHDLEVLPYGENTEIGEKGINLSGGQKARVSLARAAYSDAEIVLLDDSLSAVDAYVGKSILENCLLTGPLADKTRVLVTHALHVLDKTDYIYVMDNGVIVEQGTYTDLMGGGVHLPRIMDEYGRIAKEDGDAAADPAAKKAIVKSADADADPKTDAKQNQAALMQDEERNLGAVSWDTYAKYIRYAGTIAWAPLILGLLLSVQAAQVSNNLMLGFWTANSIHGFSQGQYMGVYAGLGVAQAVFQWAFNFSFSLMSLAAGLRMFKAALRGVLRSPTSFFDTTPIGRIVSRLSKDQDTLDTQLVQTAFQLLNTAGQAIGTIVLVFYTFPYLGILFAPMLLAYYASLSFYRRTSVETKRLDSLMRSALYASFTETLTGLSTVRAYREQERFIKTAEMGLDWENRAYYLTVTIQRWLGVRLDFFANILVLGIALFAAGFRTTVNPAKTGVVLSYTLQIVQFFNSAVTQFAQNEQNMNAVERILVYTELAEEGATTLPGDPPPSWPDQGAIRFENAEMSYREGLPLVLKGVSFDVRPGEKIGIVGRTGAGKSSLLQALFRMVELRGGQIDIDGRNIRDIGLESLRSRLALVPQDPTLFLGSLRDNLDPQKTRTDAELISALQRAWLLPREGPTDPTIEKKFSLDSAVGDEGGNYSAGERQLLALCRALVKNSRIIVLDEATSSVDVETDAKIQRTIQTEFAGSTLLCIAHRLNTICYYDRILVMDGGKVAELDTPLNLFDQEHSIFRSLCNEAKLSREEIVRIQSSASSRRTSLDKSS